MWAFLRRGFFHLLSYKIALALSLASSAIGLFRFGFMARFLQEGNAFALIEKYGGNLAGYLITGSAFMGIISLSLNTYQSAIRQEQQMGTLESLLMSKTSIYEIMGLSFLWSALSLLINGALIFAVAAFSFKIPLNINGVLTAVILCLTVIALSGIGLASAGIILVTKVGDPINWVLTTLSGFVSGVLFPVEIMPYPLQIVAECLPTTHAIKALRLAIIRGATFSAVIPELRFLAITAFITVPFGFVLFYWGFQRARKDGSLAQY